MDEQTLLAALKDFGAVTVCPGGVIHINLPHYSLKFLPSDFVKFAELVAMAVAKYEPERKPSGKPHLQLVTPQPEESEPTE